MVPFGDWHADILGMRKGLKIEVAAADRARLEAVVADRNSPQKHVWRAGIVLATADGLATAEIVRRKVGRGRSPRGRLATALYERGCTRRDSGVDEGCRDSGRVGKGFRPFSSVCHVQKTFVFRTHGRAPESPH